MSKHNLILSIIICFFITSCSSSLNLPQHSYTGKMFNKSEIQELKYGINGHSVRANRGSYTSQYNQFTIAEQVSLLKKLGVSVYRTDIYIDETGFFNDPKSPFKFEELLDSLYQNDIELLPVISTYPWMKSYEDANEPFFIGKNWDYKKLHSYLYKQDHEAAEYIQSLDMWAHYYKRGKITGEKFGKKYGDRLVYYNTGNEIGYYISKMYPHPGNPVQNPTGEDSERFFLSTYGGDDMTDFFSTEEHARRMVAATAYVKGLIDGIKSEDKEAKCVISDGKANFGFFKFLDFMNVDYDIIGWNWYIEGFNTRLPEYNYYNVYQELSRQFVGKPIWITETNRFAGSRNYSEDTVYQAERDQANRIRDYVSQFSLLDNVEAVIVYELLDQEYKFETRWEDYYGLITSPFPTKAYARPKPAFDTFRYTIEELKYANEDFVYFTLKKLFGKSPTESETSHWKSKLIEVNNKEFFLKNMLAESKNFIEWNPNKKPKKEEIDQTINPIFQQTLERNPTKREARMFRRSLMKNPNIMNLQIQLMLSDEFWQNAIWAGYEKRTGFTRP